MSNLDREEQDLLNSVENNEWQSLNNVEEAKLRYKNYAQNQLNETRFSITLNFEDAEKINQLANQSGKSVTRVSEEILHKYLEGKLIEKIT